MNCSTSCWPAKLRSVDKSGCCYDDDDNFLDFVVDDDDCEVHLIGLDCSMMMMMIMMTVDFELQYELLTGQAEKCRQEWTAVNAAYQVKQMLIIIITMMITMMMILVFWVGCSWSDQSSRWALSAFKLQCILTQPYNICRTVQCNNINQSLHCEKFDTDSVIHWFSFQLLNSYFVEKNPTLSFGAPRFTRKPVFANSDLIHMPARPSIPQLRAFVKVPTLPLPTQSKC